MNECLTLYATQSGRAKACARRTARILREQRKVRLRNGGGSAFDDCSILDFAKKESSEMKQMVFLLLFVSTTGDGEHVDAIRGTWKQLLQTSIPKDMFQGVSFALFCLGDRAYGEQFCAAGRKLAIRLLQLGASLVCEPGYGDDCTPNGGVFRDLDAWIEDNLLPSLPAAPNDIMEGATAIMDARSTLARYRIAAMADSLSKTFLGTSCEEWQQDNYNSSFQSYFGYLCPWTAYSYMASDDVVPNVLPSDGNSTITRSAPLTAKVLVKKRLTAPEWSQNTMHIELEVTSPVLLPDELRLDPPTPYRAGDVAVIIPSNTLDNVQRFLDALPASIQALADKQLRIENASLAVAGYDTTPLSGCTYWPDKCTFRGWLTHCADIHALPEREDLRALATFCSLDHEFGLEQAQKLISLSETSGAALYADYILREKRSWAEVLHDFDSLRAPGTKLTVEALFGLIGPIRPRDFSIASSPLEVCEMGKDEIASVTRHTIRLHLCVALVEGTTPLGRRYHGLCSDYLSRLQPGSSLVRLWIRRGSFAKLPLAISNHDGNFDVPVIFIGAGTGIAPLRGLIRERETRRKVLIESISILKREEETVGTLDHDNILVFGCRKEKEDFYYREEWLSLCQAGRLGLLTAFSRDQARKVYVQQVLQSIGTDASFIVSHILARNGAVYIAGGPRMARAVKDVLMASIGEALGDQQLAKQLLSNLHRAGYMSIEAWS